MTRPGSNLRLAVLLLGVNLVIFGGSALYLHQLETGISASARLEPGEHAGSLLKARLWEATAQPTDFPPVPHGPPGLRQVTTGRDGSNLETWAREVRRGW